MPDPRYATTKPSPSLLRARTYKSNPTSNFTLEVTGKGKLSTADHQQVKWVPGAPSNATWADTVEYTWQPKMADNGTYSLAPVLVQHTYVGKYADDDATVSTSLDITKSFLYAVRLLQAAGHKVSCPDNLLHPKLPPSAMSCCVC
jgi:hypothetical protein